MYGLLCALSIAYITMKSSQNMLYYRNRKLSIIGGDVDGNGNDIAVPHFWSVDMCFWYTEFIGKVKIIDKYNNTTYNRIDWTIANGKILGELCVQNIRMKKIKSMLFKFMFRSNHKFTNIYVDCGCCYQQFSFHFPLFFFFFFFFCTFSKIKIMLKG